MIGVWLFWWVVLDTPDVAISWNWWLVGLVLAVIFDGIPESKASS